MKINKTQRNSSFELLRIISMFLIIMHHFSVHGTFNNDSIFSFEKIGNEILLSGGKIGVNVFVLIGSYFLIGKNFNIKRPIKIVLNVMFYSYAVLFIALLLNWPVLSLGHIVSSIIPVPKSYWFANYYILLLLCTPALNILVNSFTKKQYQNALMFLTTIWVLIPTFFLDTMGYSPLALFVYLYLVAGYIKKFPNKILENKKGVLIFFFVSLTLTILSIYCLNFLGIRYQMALLHSDFFLYENKLLTITNSISLFLVFRNIEIKSNNIINFVAGSMFGVYLIHDNTMVREVLWKYVDSDKIEGGLNFLLYGILVSLVVFIGCTFIDLLRRLTLDKCIDKLTDRFSKILGNVLLKIRTILCGN